MYSWKMPTKSRLQDEKSGGIETSAKSSSAVGPCVNGLCPNGYDCIGNKCYKSNKNPVAKAIGPCVNLRCPAGYKCNLSDNQCYA
uniref:CC domain-containing protein n=1 Tax=Acrobeloides nanus TaxID=290746 RepID=A0A914ESX1_9BILA